MAKPTGVAQSITTLSVNALTLRQQETRFMHDQKTIDLLNQTKRTRRIAYAMILLALALPSLFAWRDGIGFESAGDFTGQLAAVTLLALIVRLWIARHYFAGIQVQALLAFALILICWSGYESRQAHDERVAAAAQSVNSPTPRVPDR